jgi:tRNA dimethylallyltransferase
MNLTIDLNERKALVITGPTAVGKTALSLLLAEELNGEIVSADSRQVYKYMDIGTAKPSREEQEKAPHHFIDVKMPDQYYSAGEYGREARLCVADIFSRGRIPIIVGGSGFYIKALVDGLSASNLSDSAVKERWSEKIRLDGIDAVFKQLWEVDPATAAVLHPNDSQRVVRAMEVWELTGKSISSFQKGDEANANFDPLFIGLNRERPKLYQRIENRVDIMLQSGLVDEVRQLQELGYTSQLNALRTVGYQEVFDYLNASFDFGTMTDKIKMNTRRYAKRQLTWFRKESRIHWFSLDIDSTSIIAEKVAALYTL